ncbi:MFS1 family protein [Mytilinidion resinicola]|uniref:MFS1 family protein n=1 Tax=Mytilinidion resinicola TaxID=574789 RepID=A0A6A6ZB02_9PEZI|nr:MFS1 family protein [Mytilinidion resinicola]KAF2817485.1 MFS1 family protein [Mytilinidion resinicola]
MFSKWRSPPAAGDSTEPLPGPREKQSPGRAKSRLGILNDLQTDEVPGSVILLSDVHKRNEPLGLQHQHARTSASSLPSPYPPSINGRSSTTRSIRKEEKKKSKDGKFVLQPQPEDTKNDPLNWAIWRRDAALYSLGFYCMVGGGMTPILAAGFNNVAQTYDVSISRVSLTTGLYMMGLGLGGVIASPTAILYGKRPVYLVSIIIFCLASVWCALSPSYPSLVVARIVQGMAVSPVEVLPSATVAEIFFLHERAYRLGIYTLLLLAGKNLVPLVSAAIIQSMGWRWTFWVVAIIVGGCFFLLFLFVPETFWDRTPHARQTHRHRSRSPGKHGPFNLPSLGRFHHHQDPEKHLPQGETLPTLDPTKATLAQRRLQKNVHVGFAPEDGVSEPSESHVPTNSADAVSINQLATPHTAGQDGTIATHVSEKTDDPGYFSPNPNTIPGDVEAAVPIEHPVPATPDAVHFDGPFRPAVGSPDLFRPGSAPSIQSDGQQSFIYTEHYRAAPPKSFIKALSPWNGRLVKDSWHRVLIRPFILFAYPSVLWSTLVYSLSIGWLIVLSESVAAIYRDRELYNFTALQTGLVYLSPFIGGVIGTAVAGKISDYIVRYMASKNDGVYEPEFRLVMAIPIAISTVIGLMGFGWSAQERDAWIVPTVFFGIISFGCSLGSTTAITFCVDSYRQYAGEALVTLNFSKNIFHGLVFSLFFTHWLESSGAKTVFLAVGGLQLACLTTTIPMYIYGKRARMWTVRKNLMEKF